MWSTLYLQGPPHYAQSPFWVAGDLTCAMWPGQLLGLSAWIHRIDRTLREEIHMQSATLWQRKLGDSDNFLGDKGKRILALLCFPFGRSLPLPLWCGRAGFISASCNQCPTWLRRSEWLKGCSATSTTPWKMEGTSSGPKATEDTETSLWLWTLLAGFGVSLKSVHQELSLKCVFRFLGVGGFYLNF